MQALGNYRSFIGESPIWNGQEKRLYHVNPGEKAICCWDLETKTLKTRKVDVNVAALAFSKDQQLLVSRPDGVYILHEDNSVSPLYDTQKHHIRICNDMKVGPDGRLYVGTQSGKRAGISDRTDGKLYSIDAKGNVRILLDNLILSNGLDWSIDEQYLYHTDSDTHTIREYSFDKISGDISFTGRQVPVLGVDGLTVDLSNRIYAACWGQGHIAVIDPEDFKIKNYIEVPAKIPASCCFAGEQMDQFVVVTAAWDLDLQKERNAGLTFVSEGVGHGRLPYLFG